MVIYCKTPFLEPLVWN